MIKVAIAEDHQLVREGIVALLSRNPDIAVVGEAFNGDQALTLVKTHEPDVLVMDVSMPDKDGLETLEQLQLEGSKVPVVILTMHGDAAVVRRALDAGAKGYVVKGSIADDLIRAIEIAHQGGTFIAPGAGETTKPAVASSQTGDVLTPREREVLVQIGEGLTNQGIASQLGISIKTVERHRTSVMRKLGTRNVVELIRAAVREGYISLDG